MKKHFLAFAISVCALASFAQPRNETYYGDGGLIHLTSVQDEYVLEFESSSDRATVLNSLQSFPDVQILIKNLKMMVVRTNNTQSINSIKQMPQLRTFNPVFQNKSDIKIYGGSALMVYPKPETRSDEIDALFAQYGVTRTRNVYGEIRGTVSRLENVFEISRLLQASGLFEYSLPNYRADLAVMDHIPNDEYFSWQFYLKNTGQEIVNRLTLGTPDSSPNGKTKADINIEHAWDVTKGDPNLIVAVIDRGVEPHPDLPSERLVLGATITEKEIITTKDIGGRPDEAAHGYLYHGQAVAGIIAATQDNHIGISGVAPNVKIMPINPFSSFDYKGVDGDDDDPIPGLLDVIATAIRYAYMNGADIISNSYHLPFTESEPDFPNVKRAIEEAHILGRNGKGCVVVFSASNQADRLHNQADNKLTYPSIRNYPGLISVGASDYKDEVANYSPNGYQVDVVAPSSKYLTVDENGGYEGTAGVFTIDPKGFEHGVTGTGDCPNQNTAYSEMFDYTCDFGGTSAAAPMASGVAALVLSVDPELNHMDVEEILKTTATKIGGYNYDAYSSTFPGQSKETGAGRLNALRAVKIAQRYDHAQSWDLAMRDNVDEKWIEPSRDIFPWVSPDIWIRSSDDGKINQFDDPALEWRNHTRFHLYVRVRNQGKQAFVKDLHGNAYINLYWAKASTNLSWPFPWRGANESGARMGDPINLPILIDDLPAGAEKIYHFFWDAPNPDDYTLPVHGEKGHFCFLARITTTGPNEGMRAQEGPVMAENARNNNNVAWRNVTFKKIFISPEHGCVYVKKVAGTTSPIELSVSIPPNEATSILERATVELNLPNQLYQGWVLGGQIGSGIVPVGPVLKVMQTPANLRNIKISSTLTQNVCFKVTPKASLFDQRAQSYAFDLIQKSDGQVIGGERFIFNFDATQGVLSLDHSEDILELKEAIYQPINSEEPIKIGKPDESIRKITILDLSGRTLDVDQGKGEFDYSLKKLPAGCYILTINNLNTGQFTSGKIIVN